MIKKVTTVMMICCCLSATNLYSQTVNALRIDSCYAMAKRNYPLVNQYALIEKSREYAIDNVNKQYLPRFYIAGQATYQSEVVQIPISLPDANIDPLSKDQYKLYGEVSQPITDLFTVRDQNDWVKANAQVAAQKIEVELYKLRERINNLFFGLLLIDAQIQQTDLLKKDMQSGIDKTNSAIANGIALKSTADNLKAELLRANQRDIELKANRKSYVGMLALFIGKPLDQNTVLEKPSQPFISDTVNRPELRLYEFQKKAFDIQSKLIEAKNLPQFSFFFQGGLGRPAIDILNNDFSGYYIGGLRLNWNLTGLYTSKKEQQILVLNQNSIDIQRAVFLFNTDLTLQQHNSEATKVQELINTDGEIISLRESIKNTIKNQLENGTATTNDYLTAVNIEDQARQNLLLHQIQLLMARYNYRTTSGN